MAISGLRCLAGQGIVEIVGSWSDYAGSSCRGMMESWDYAGSTGQRMVEIFGLYWLFGPGYDGNLGITLALLGRVWFSRIMLSLRARV